MRGHDDEAQDRKLFGKMLKKAMPAKKESPHKSSSPSKMEPKDTDVPTLGKLNKKTGMKVDSKKTKYAKVGL